MRNGDIKNMGNQILRLNIIVLFISALSMFHSYIIFEHAKTNLEQQIDINNLTKQVFELKQNKDETQTKRTP